MWLIAKDVYWPYVNHVSREFIDPVLGRIAGGNLILIAVMQCFVFFILTWLSISFLFAKANATCIKASDSTAGFGKNWLVLNGLSAFCLSVSCVILMWLNPFLLNFHFAPLIVLLLVSRERLRVWMFFLGLSLSCGHLVFSCGPQAFGVLLLLWGGSALWRARSFRCSSASSSVDLATALPRRASVATSRAELLEVVIMFAWLVFSFLAMPKYQMPDYPAEAKLAPISVLSSSAAVSRLGGWLNPQPVIYSRLQQTSLAYLERYVILTIACLGALLIGVRGQRKMLLPCLVLTLFLGATVTSEFVFPEDWLAYCPGLSLRRLIPGMPLIVSSVIFLPVLLLLGFTFAVMSFWSGCPTPPRQKQVVWNLACLSISLLCVLGLSLHGLAPNAYLQSEIIDNQSGEARIQMSPSGYVLEVVGPWVASAEEVAKRDLANLNKLDLAGVRVSTSVQPELGPLMLDGKLETRWSTKRPAAPGDAVSLDLNAVRNIMVVDLALGKASSDFPRGIALSISVDGKSFREVFREDDWQGEVRWTADGFPYFMGQQAVQIQLAEVVSARYLRIEQTAQGDHFDWSIAEIRIFEPGLFEFGLFEFGSSSPVQSRPVISHTGIGKLHQGEE